MFNQYYNQKIRNSDVKEKKYLYSVSSSYIFFHNIQ